MYKVIQKTDSIAQIENTTSNETYTLRVIYDHKEFGKFYVFSSILTMPFHRKAIFDLIRQHEVIGTDKKGLISENEEILDLLIKKPEGFEHTIYTMLYNRNLVLKDSWDFFKTASAIVPLLIVPECDLETIGVYEQEKQDQYINLWSKDSAMFAFFLSIVQRKMNNFYNHFNPASRDYLDRVSQLTENPQLNTKESMQQDRTKSLWNWSFWLRRKIMQSVTG